MMSSRSAKRGKPGAELAVSRTGRSTRQGKLPGRHVPQAESGRRRGYGDHEGVLQQGTKAPLARFAKFAHIVSRIACRGGVPVRTGRARTGRGTARRRQVALGLGTFRVTGDHWHPDSDPAAATAASAAAAAATAADVPLGRSGTGSGRVRPGLLLGRSLGP